MASACMECVHFVGTPQRAVLCLKGVRTMGATLQLQSHSLQHRLLLVCPARTVGTLMSSCTAGRTRGSLMVGISGKYRQQDTINCIRVRFCARASLLCCPDGYYSRLYVFGGNMCWGWLLTYVFVAAMAKRFQKQKGDNLLVDVMATKFVADASASGPEPWFFIGPQLGSRTITAWQADASGQRRNGAARICQTTSAVWLCWPIS